MAALKAGWDFTASGVQINRFCASGLEAVNMAAQKVRSGWEDLVVAGGVESMSRVPIGSDGGAWRHNVGGAQAACTPPATTRSSQPERTFCAAMFTVRSGRAGSAPSFTFGWPC